MVTINYMIQKIIAVFATIKPLGGIIIALLAFFAPIATIVHGVLILVALDLFTGIGAHFKKDNYKFCWFKAKCWRHITSQKLGKTITKTLTYLILIITGFIIDTLILPGLGSLIITKIMAGSVALRELKSLIENSEIILGGGIVMFIKAVAKYGFSGAMQHMLKENQDMPKENYKEN